jgi:hypothetical protein
MSRITTITSRTWTYKVGFFETLNLCPPRFAADNVDGVDVQTA